MVTIKLANRQWTYDPERPLGPEGGFGEVFLGEGLDGETVAVKRLKLTAAESAYRELRIADLLLQKELKHVMPVYDFGQDAESDYYFVVMPQAEQSLQQKLDAGGIFNSAQAAAILREIALGLLEVGNLVHRDLKPGNILYFNSSWRVADFGIARFVEESTSSRTLKDCLSPPYAAPEQWQLKRATSATDVYALGCVGYALLTGRHPFPGPSVEDYQDQHLHADPPSVPQCEPTLRAMLTMMLRKVPDARPSLKRVVDLLEGILSTSSSASVGSNFSSLASAGASVARKQAEEEAMLSKESSERERRRDIAAQAEKIFKYIREELFRDICEVAPIAVKEDEARVRLGSAVLVLRLIGETGGIAADAFPLSKWDVVLGAEIAVRQDSPRYVRSSSIWYSKLLADDEYRWREVSYFGSPFLSDRSPYEPHSLNDFELADQVAAAGMAEYLIAWGPQPIDDENLPDFKSRWAGLLAKAADGKLSHPRRLPLQ